jgi:signal peptidase I
MLKIFKTIILIVLIFLQVLFLKEFVIGFYKVPSNSMAPSIHSGDLIIVSKLAYKFAGLKVFEPDIGDVIVFKNENINLKRILAKPEDKIYFDKIKIYKKKPKDIIVDSLLLNKEEYFVVGDNRAKSYDSRNYGAIQYDSIIGKMLFKLK